ncbi:hypothetical protein [Fictibacillus phosphorivorans]|uniref:hypothetical protein n=1 Tax=Fictibacillus phosphorivorans TaxID=1221500 RepID=UPI00203E4048|nr:hypothetical protein [Fictibacillus phosphorivorans]MCM3718982.1 hypothetical protein [Fictibacillus phosphorivorans]MCM3776604.1 hypothetical protein [Fictibacillus phosphorivorans]
MKLKNDLDGKLFERRGLKDPDALKQIVSSYSTLLLQKITRITGDQQVSEKILVEVFHEVLDKPIQLTPSPDTNLLSDLVKRCKMKCVQMEEKHLKSLLSKKSKNYIAACRSI